MGRCFLSCDEFQAFQAKAQRLLRIKQALAGRQTADQISQSLELCEKDKLDASL